MLVAFVASQVVHVVLVGAADWVVLLVGFLLKGPPAPTHQPLGACLLILLSLLLLER